MLQLNQRRHSQYQRSGMNCIHNDRNVFLHELPTGLAIPRERNGMKNPAKPAPGRTGKEDGVPAIEGGQREYGERFES